MYHDVFLCPEESSFYAHCLCNLLAGHCRNETLIHEFGSGEGLPMVDALRHSNFRGVVHGYEIQHTSCKLANKRIEEYQVHPHYIVHHEDFFDAIDKPNAGTLVTNPPYLPACDPDVLYLKCLYGGADGSMISRRLLSLGYATVMLMLSSFSDPAGLLHFAGDQGYSVVDFVIQPLIFGRYSSQPEVKSRIMELYRDGNAFFSEHYYLLAGVVFQKRNKVDEELSSDLMALMRSIRLKK
jgi:hypothetical protein